MVSLMSGSLRDLVLVMKFDMGGGGAVVLRRKSS